MIEEDDDEEALSPGKFSAMARTSRAANIIQPIYSPAIERNNKIPISVPFLDSSKYVTNMFLLARGSAAMKVKRLFFFLLTAGLQTRLGVSYHF